MRLWQYIDELVGQAVRRELTPVWSRNLHGFLVILGLVGLTGASIRPDSAVVCLIFPLLLISFFEDVKVGLLLCPLFVAVYSGTHVEALDVGLFFALCIFSVAISGVTSHKYRQVFLHSRQCASRLSMARVVQQTMEPPPRVTLGPLRVHTRMEVCHDLGGDFVGVARLSDGGALVLIGDVQGKGPQSALTAAYVEGIFQHCGAVGIEQPQEILEHLHNLLAGKGAGRFVTALCLRSCPQGRNFQMANAGHPLPIVFGRKPRTEGLSGLVLGLEGMLGIVNSSFEVSEDERILLVSDGCYDEESVTPGLANFLRSPTLGMSEILGWLDDKADREHPDDRTVVLIEPSGSQGSI